MSTIGRLRTDKFLNSHLVNDCFAQNSGLIPSVNSYGNFRLQAEQYKRALTPYFSTLRTNKFNASTGQLIHANDRIWPGPDF
jgi:hypothetical protein